MALRWLLHSACHALGYPNEESGVGYPMKAKEIKAVSGVKENKSKARGEGSFQIPLHYPRYTKSDYEKMEEWRLDLLLSQYGLTFIGTVQDKRDFAIGAFLWPDQY